jgi:hypothetical protein
MQIATGRKSTAKRISPVDANFHFIAAYVCPMQTSESSPA